MPLTLEQKLELHRLYKTPEEDIDLSDIPDVSNRTGWTRIMRNKENIMNNVLYRSFFNAQMQNLRDKIISSDCISGYELKETKNSYIVKLFGEGQIDYVEVLGDLSELDLHFESSELDESGGWRMRIVLKVGEEQ